MKEWSLERLRDAGMLTDLDVQFARALGRIGGESDPRVLEAAALACRGVRLGQVCLDLDDPAPEPPAEGGRPTWPAAEAWRDALSASPLVGGEDQDRPLVLDSRGRLYLHRFCAYERRLAELLRGRAEEDVPVDEAALARVAGRLFEATGERDLQREAALAAARGRLAIVVGGPGTGKTTTVVKILALCQALEPDRTLRIALLAPTGKAAARLESAVRGGVERLDVDDHVKQRVRVVASTIHRALGVRPDARADFRHDAEHPLAVDLVVVDEASMVDLALMTKLVDAVPPAARLVLLGDRRQLASVEAGAVLADLCEAALAGGPLAGRVVELLRVYRYDEESGIARLADAVKSGDPERVREVLTARHDDLTWVPISADAAARRLVDDDRLLGFDGYLSEETAEGRLERIDDYRILTAHRGGWLGVAAWNDAVRERLVAGGRLERTNDEWYDLRPVIVTRNDPAIALYNGDVGVCMRDRDEDGAVRPRDRVVFRGDEGRPRSIPAARLPAPETVFAMTVHKSQGSEFDHVCLVVPPTDSPILTRELLYTGLTRARRRLTVLADADVLARGVNRRIRRASGLVLRLSR